jgi:hypothetical protein
MVLVNELFFILPFLNALVKTINYTVGMNVPAGKPGSTGRHHIYQQVRLKIEPPLRLFPRVYLQCLKVRIVSF